MNVKVAFMTTRKQKVHGPTAITVARNVARLRKSQGLTRRDLEARTRTDPHDESSALVTVEMLRGIENSADPAPGKTVRRVDADDLVALALALGVNPNALLLPPTVKGTIELTGHGEVPAEYAWAWADGQRPLVYSPDATEVLEFVARTRPRGVRPEDLSSAIERADSIDRLFRQATPRHPMSPVQPSELLDEREETPPDGED